MSLVALLKKAPTAAETQALCPTCSAIVVVSAKECPECGEVFGADTFKEFLPERGSGGRLERLLFWAGLGLVVVGGPGVALGSYLHDLLRIPIGGTNFESFGPINRFVAALGLIILIVGIVVLLISLRLSKPSFEDDYDVGAPKGA